jgi:preprotein translocase subunit SecG
MILYGLVLVVHVLVAVFLIAVILLQGGRGGLGEALGGAAAQSLFGGGANTVMTKITAVGASLFMVTCLSLAALSTARGGSVMDRLPMTTDQLPIALPQPSDQMPQPLEPSIPNEAPPLTDTTP